MSELNIKVRKSQDNGSTFRATPDTLYMGGVGSAKVDTLHFEVPEEWAGCAITLHVKRLSGALPDPQMLDENNCIVVDRRWTQEKQGSWMLLAVDENGYIAMTKPGQYTCYETIDTNSTTETITPSVYEQFVAAVEKWGQTAVDAAAKAKSSEEKAAASASASAGSAAAAARSQSAAAWRATKAADSASAADRAKTDAQTAAQQSEASAKKAGKALSDTITAKEDALKAIGDKQTTATQAVDTARDKALRQVESSTEAAQTAATQAVDTVRDKALQQVKASTEAAQTAATQAVDTVRDKALQQVKASTEAAQTAATQAVDTVRNKALQQVKASTEAAQTAATQAVDTVRNKALQQVKASTEAAQTAATQAVDTARDKALQQMEASKAAAQTAASEAAASAGNADQSAQEAADSLQELKDGIAAGNFKGEPGNDGKSPVVTVTDIENGHRVSITDKDGTKTIDVLNGQTGKTGAAPVLTIGTVSSGDKPSADITGTPENPVLNLRLQPGPQGPAVALDTSLTHEGEAADAKATGDAISAVKARQNILIGTETGNQLSVDDAFAAPLCGLTVYGKSTQDGTPTPDAPVPIVSAGDSGSVTVKVTGKNLLYEQEFQNYFINAGANIVGLANGNVSVVLQVVTGAKYYVTRNKVGTRFRVAVVDELPAKDQTVRPSSGINGDSKRQVEISATSKYMVIQCEDEASFSELMVSLDSSTAYSPYHEQLLTLPTPTGLPGIPVVAGGNYTDPQGQQWICDEVDLERGVKVQRVNRLKLDALSWRYELTPTNKSDTFISDVPASQDGTTRGHSLCQYAVFDGVAYDIEMKEACRCYAWVKSVTLQFKAGSGVDSVDAFSEWLKSRPDASIFYCLATPIETTLTPAEIAAYKALTAYGPDTVVQAGDGAGIRLEYQRDVNIAIKHIEDAVASMT